MFYDNINVFKTYVKIIRNVTFVSCQFGLLIVLIKCKFDESHLPFHLKYSKLSGQCQIVMDKSRLSPIFIFVIEKRHSYEHNI